MIYISVGAVLFIQNSMMVNAPSISIGRSKHLHYIWFNLLYLAKFLIRSKPTNEHVTTLTHTHTHDACAVLGAGLEH